MANLFKNVPIPVHPDEKLQAFLRIRPVEEPAGKRPFVVSQNLLLTAPPDRSKAFKNLKDGASGCRQFTFNHIFDQDVGQEDFYEKCALPLTVRLLRGESSLLFAYGTTNSGKSYTMRGTPSDPGVIPRALSTLFTCIGSRIDQTPAFRACRFAEADPLTPDEVELELNVRKFICTGNKQRSSSITSFRNLSISRDSTLELLEESSLNHPNNSDMRFSVWVSFVEFYMDTMNDLLAVEMDNKKNPQLMLIQDQVNNYFVKGLRRVSVSSADEAYFALLYGWENLHRAATLLNKDSSRSHCVFTITLIGHETSSCTRLRQVSNLSFCDLAGSERGDRTQNTGNRLKEAGKINNSLSTLGRCISALRHNQRKKSKLVVPFRDSSLTKYFQSYFNGTGIASMIININPSVEYFDETLVTLQFSAEASDLTVSSEEARLKLKESFTRLTQQWIQSSQRWSSFSKLKPDPRLVSTILCPETSVDEVVEEEDDGEITADDLETLQTSILQTGDVATLTALLEQIDTLTEKLQTCEDDKLNLEVQIRKEVNQEIRAMEQQFREERADERAARRENEQKLRNQLRELKQTHRLDIENQEKVMHELKHELSLKSVEIAIRERDISSLTQQIASLNQRLHEAEKKHEQVAEHLNVFINNNEIPAEASDPVRRVCEMIMTRYKQLVDLREAYEQKEQSLQSEIQLLRKEKESAAELRAKKLVTREVACNTSLVKTKDMMCGTSSPCTHNQETSTRILQCQDQGSSPLRVPVCDKHTSPIIPAAVDGKIAFLVPAPRALTDATVGVKSDDVKQEKPQSASGTSVSGEEDGEADVSLEIGVTKKRKLPDSYLQAIRQKVSRCSK